MSHPFRIVADWESLDEGPSEERSCFAALGIEANGIWLTEGQDSLANRLRQSPLLSAYHLAEWFAWNWWRLRWEPRALNQDWAFAHKTSTIGGGYVWPNITIFSDGERTALISKPTRERVDLTYRYINDAAAIVPSTAFESVVDEFLAQVIERLSADGLKDANLVRLWEDVTSERSDPEIARARKLEALLGMQPDEVDDEIINDLVSDAKRFGISAMDELAADSGNRESRRILSASDLIGVASKVGFDVEPRSMVQLYDSTEMLQQRGYVPAWRRGADLAKSLRGQEHAGEMPIDNDRLADFLCVDKSIVRSPERADLGVSFLVDEEGKKARVVLKSKRETSRRFDLARLLGDELMYKSDCLFPATRANTYRQKAQRAFAAELLSPFSAIIHMLNGDYSLENQQDVADYFGVSEITIRTQLVNYKVLDREDLDPEWAVAA